MVDSILTDFHLIKLKTDAAIDDVGTEAHNAWNGLVNELKNVPGYNNLFFGRQLENPSVGVLCAVRSSYAASSANQSLPGNFSALADSVTTHSLDADATAVLVAPTTEVFTGYGAEPGFAENVKLFAEKVNAEKPEGYIGVAYGEVLGEISKGPDEPKGKAVKLLIGWTSKEAHVEAKSQPGAISNNIGLLRELRKGVDMFHVQFNEL